MSVGSKDTQNCLMGTSDLTFSLPDGGFRMRQIIPFPVSNLGSGSGICGSYLTPTPWPNSLLLVCKANIPPSRALRMLWLLTHSDPHVCPALLSGDASLLTDQRGHPRGLGNHAVVSGRHAGQRWITGSTASPAQSLDVELDPGERSPSFPEPSWRESSSTTARGEGHQGSRLPGPGRRSASQDLLVIVVTLTEHMPPSWWDQGDHRSSTRWGLHKRNGGEAFNRTFLHFKGKSADNPHVYFEKWTVTGPWTFLKDR